MTVTSRRGAVETVARVTGTIKPGVVFMPFHFAEAAANELTNTAVDPVAKIPELKACAVRVAKRAGGMSEVVDTKRIRSARQAAREMVRRGTVEAGR